MRKLAALSAIGLLIVVSVCLRPDVAPKLVPARPLMVTERPAEIRPGVRPGSDQGRTGVRLGSESRYGATQLPGTNARQELRTPVDAPAVPEPLPARALLSATLAPSVAREPIVTARRGQVTRALATAGHETASAFRVAGRALRSVF